MSKKGDANGGSSFDHPERSSRRRIPISRREFVELVAITGTGLASQSLSAQTLGPESQHRTANDGMDHQETRDSAMSGENSMSDEIVKEKIRRALLSGP